MTKRKTMPTRDQLFAELESLSISAHHEKSARIQLEREREASLVVQRNASMALDNLRSALETIARTTFSGSEMNEEYQRGNRDAHSTCARIALAALKQEKEG